MPRPQMPKQFYAFNFLGKYFYTHNMCCMQDTFARARTRPKDARDDRISCIQPCVVFRNKRFKDIKLKNIEIYWFRCCTL